MRRHKDFFLTGLIARSFELQDQIEKKAFDFMGIIEDRREALSEDYIQGLMIGGFLFSLAGVGVGWVLWGPK